MVIIRLLEAVELDFLTDMLYEAIQIPENKPSKEVLINEVHIKKYHEGWGREGDSALIAINTNNEAVGVVWYRLFDEANKGYGYVDNSTPELSIAITKNARGIGIGTQLMEEIIELAKREGYKALSLSVDPTNKNAVHIYKKLGFEQCGVSGTSITMVLNIIEV